MSTTVSPSPRELFARLSDEEKVAVDLLLQEDGHDAVLSALVFDSRRDHLRGLSVQLKALGFSVQDSPELDQQRETWEEARRRFDEEMNQRLREQADERARDQQWLEALSPEVRRAVARQRRRRARRRGRQP
jgi:hypothetical protein